MLKQATRNFVYDKLKIFIIVNLIPFHVAWLVTNGLQIRQPLH